MLRKIGYIVVKLISHQPDDFQETVRDDEHLPSYFSLAANQVTGREDEGAHLQDKIMQKLRFTLLEESDLSVMMCKHVKMGTL